MIGFIVLVLLLVLVAIVVVLIVLSIVGYALKDVAKDAWDGLKPY